MPADPQAITQIFELFCRPGVKRDGTDLDSEYWQDAQWTRFQRGRPRKIGGYKSMSQQLVGPIRGVYVDSRASGNTVHTMSQWGVEQLLFDDNGNPSGSVFNRTPGGFAANAKYTWQSAVMFQSGGGGTPTLICAATPDLDSIASDTAGPLYSGDVTASATLTAVSDGSPITVSGGCCVLQPFLFVYGSNGLIRNSNPNDISAATGWATGGANKANTANVASTKIVKGLPMRGGGQSPAGLFWALDALIRVSYIGGTALWQYDTLSDDVTVLSKSGIVEYDNAYYWVGVDRFYVFNGVVQELPNAMNINWFFDNLNPAQRQKVWALKVPRFGEIWWFFPFGTDTECSAAVIYNVREKTWYDTRVVRSAGFPARVFPRPILAGESQSTVALSYTPVSGAFTPNETVRGDTSGATGVVVRSTSTQLNLTSVSGTFLNGETVRDTTHGGVDVGTVSAAPFTQQLDTLWQHEYGADKIVGSSVNAIEAYATSTNFQWMTGGPTSGQQAGPNVQMRVLRVEPDFIQSGDMTVEVVGRSYANAPENAGDPYTFSPTTEFVDLREQRRLAALRFKSNVAGGDFQMGRVLLTAEPGDERG